jgi:hypothetical protein
VSLVAADGDHSYWLRPHGILCERYVASENCWAECLLNRHFVPASQGFLCAGCRSVNYWVAIRHAGYIYIHHRMASAAEFRAANNPVGQLGSRSTPSNILNLCLCTAIGLLGYAFTNIHWSPAISGTGCISKIHKISQLSVVYCVVRRRERRGDWGGHTSSCRLHRAIETPSSPTRSSKPVPQDQNYPWSWRFPANDTRALSCKDGSGWRREADQ